MPAPSAPIAESTPTSTSTICRTSLLYRYRPAEISWQMCARLCGGLAWRRVQLLASSAQSSRRLAQPKSRPSDKTGGGACRSRLVEWGRRGMASQPAAAREEARAAATAWLPPLSHSHTQTNSRTPFDSVTVYSAAAAFLWPSCCVELVSASVSACRIRCRICQFRALQEQRSASPEPRPAPPGPGT